MQLTNREHAVLATIVEHFIRDAKPVGSRTVARDSGLSLSPASMRTVMADLTDKGFLEQPHTSAGRAPTPRAFRWYLSAVLAPQDLDGEARRTIQDSLDLAGLDMPEMLRRASHALSSCVRQVGMALAPGGFDVRWRSIDFVSVRSDLVMAVLVLDGGVVQNRMLPVQEELSRDELVRFGNYLNHHFAGMTLSEARTRILRELDGAGRRMDRLYHRALTLANATFDAEDGRDLFVGGASRLLDQPEFTDAETVRELLDLFDERSRLLELLDRTIEAGEMRITFSTEAEASGEDARREYSLISSPYGGQGGPRGVVGVIGPLRMDYARIVPAVDFTARVLTDLIRNRH
ncbi:heat-inducible transcriptional repressor HrcA [Desulfocurvus sp. DL9XJH121]